MVWQRSGERPKHEVRLFIYAGHHACLLDMYGIPGILAESSFTSFEPTTCTIVPALAFRPLMLVS
jgi:hypothetical protein